MYASFFGLRDLPFNNTPDPRFFFSTPDHEEALASLIYAISERKGFVLLTGEVGSGKTLIARLMVRHFGDRIAFASVNNTQITPQELLLSICAELDISLGDRNTNLELIRALQDFLLARFAENRPVVLMLDEAQSLTREAFEQIRMIGNLESDDAKLLQIVIVGQPELRGRFEAADMRQLRQRLFRSFHLPGLTREQTAGYIRHRLSVAGAKHPEEIIDPWGIDVVHEYAQGLPRLINTVCDNALLSAYAANRNVVDGEFVRKVISQMMTISQDAAAARRWDNIESSPPSPGRSTEPRPPVAEPAPWEVTAPPQFASEVRKAKKSRKEGARQLHDMTLVARRLLRHSRQATREAREVIRFASTVASEADRSLARLEQQATQTGELATACHQAVDQVVQQATRVAQADPRKAGAACLTRSASPTTRALVDRSHDLDRVIQQNRDAVEQVRVLIEASRDADRPAPPVAPPESQAAPARRRATSIKSSSPTVTSLRLVERVRALAAMVEDSRRRSAFRALEIDARQRRAAKSPTPPTK